MRERVKADYGLWERTKKVLSKAGTISSKSPKERALLIVGVKKSSRVLVECHIRDWDCVEVI